jgi:hypothetical protein
MAWQICIRFNGQFRKWKTHKENNIRVPNNDSGSLTVDKSLILFLQNLLEHVNIGQNRDIDVNFLIKLRLWYTCSRKIEYIVLLMFITNMSVCVLTDITKQMNIHVYINTIRDVGYICRTTLERIF